MMDFAQALVWETEGQRGAAERGWLGEEARMLEHEQQLIEQQELSDSLVLESVKAELATALAEIERLRALSKEAMTLVDALWKAAPDEYFWDYDRQVIELLEKKP